MIKSLETAQDGYDVAGQEWTEMRADYSAGRESRFTRRRDGIPHAGAPADYHARDESMYFRRNEIARDMDRNDVLGGPVIDRATDYLINGGFEPDPETGDVGLDQEFRERWNEESTSPDLFDVQGERDFKDLEWELARDAYVVGDTFCLLTDEDRVQAIENHQVRTPSGRPKNVVNGVVMNDMRQRIAVTVARDTVSPQNPSPRLTDMRTYPVRDNEGYRRVLQVYASKRTTQTRGITAFAPIFDHMGMFDDNNFAQLVKQQIAACVTIVEERSNAFVPDPLNTTLKEGGDISYDDAFSRYLQDWRPGRHIRAPKGVTLKPFVAEIPNAEWFDHMNLIMQLISINLGMPLELLLLDGSRTNFSGWRGAIENTKIGFRRRQGRLCRRFHKPLWYWKVRSWMNSDRAIARAKNSKVNPLRHKWNLPGWPYIEPLVDSQSDAFQVNNLQNSPRRIHAGRGREHRQIVEETIDDNAFAIETAINRAAAINKGIPKDQPEIVWYDLLRLPTADRVTRSFNEREADLAADSPSGPAQRQTPNRSKGKPDAK